MRALGFVMELIGLFVGPGLATDPDLFLHIDRLRQAGRRQGHPGSAKLRAGQDRDHGDHREDRQNDEKPPPPKTTNCVGNCRHVLPR